MKNQDHEIKQYAKAKRERQGIALGEALVGLRSFEISLPLNAHGMAPPPQIVYYSDSRDRIGNADDLQCLIVRILDETD